MSISKLCIYESGDMSREEAALSYVRMLDFQECIAGFFRMFDDDTDGPFIPIEEFKRMIRSSDTVLTGHYNYIDIGERYLAARDSGDTVEAQYWQERLHGERARWSAHAVRVELRKQKKADSRIKQVLSYPRPTRGELADYEKCHAMTIAKMESILANPLASENDRIKAQLHKDTSEEWIIRNRIRYAFPRRVDSSVTDSLRGKFEQEEVSARKV